MVLKSSCAVPGSAALSEPLQRLPLQRGGEAQLPPKSICEQFSKVPASHRGKQEQMRGRTDKTCPATLEQN